MSIKNTEDIQSELVTGADKTRIQVLIDKEQNPHFSMRKFTILPGGSIPLHKNLVEHEQYVLSGQAEVIIGDEAFTAKKDDVIFIPNNIYHSYTNTGDGNYEFLCIIPNTGDTITFK